VGSVLASMETKNFWIALLTAVIIITFYPIFLGHFYAVGDMRDVFIPLESFFRQEILSLRLPAWNPNIAWGYPVIASAQIGFFYPPLLILRLLPLWLYLPLILVGHFLALGLGTFFFFRALKLTPAAAYLGSLSFTLGSFIVQHLTHLNIIITAAWFPWQLFLIHALAAKKKINLGDTARLALIFGLPFLAGQLQIPTMMAIVSSAYFLYLRWPHRQTPFQPVAILLAVALGAMLVSSAQTLPTLELVMQSSRGPAGDFNIIQANQHSFPLYSLPTLIFPHFYGNDSTYWGARLQIEYGIFIGTIPLILALWTLLNRSPKLKIQNPKQAQSSKSKNLTFGLCYLDFFTWLLIISFLLALGSLSPFRLIGLEPSLWVFSAPARWLLFTTFALSLFAAQGFDRLPGHYRSFRRLATTAAVTVIVIAALGTITLFAANEARLQSLARGLFWGSLNRPEAYYTDKFNSLIKSARASSVSLAAPATYLPVILLAATPLLVTRKRGRSVILAVTTVELVIIAATTNPSIPWTQALDQPDTISGLPSSVLSGQARLFSIQQPGDTGQYFTNPETRANSARREEYRQLLLPLSHSLFNVPGVAWPASLNLAGHADQLDQIRAPDTYWIKDQSRAEQFNLGAILVPASLAPAGSSLPHHTVGGINIYQLTPAPRADSSGPAVYQSISPSHTKITVAAPTDTTLIVRDSFYPGWRASVDGRPVPITRTDSIFRKLDLPAGQHVIDMKYVPTLLYAGAGISAAALVLCLFIAYKKRV